MLLSVVEESRKQEVLDNLRVCADIIEEISGDLKQLEGTQLNRNKTSYYMVVWRYKSFYSICVVLGFFDQWTLVLLHFNQNMSKY